MFTFTKKHHLHSGRLVQHWTFEAKSPLLSSAAAVDIDGDGKHEIIFGTKDGRIICLNEDAQQKWEYRIQEQIGETESFFYDTDRIDAVPATPTIEDINHDGAPEIIFGTELGTVYCLNYKGNLLWKYKGKGAIHGKIIAADVDGDGDKDILFGTTEGELIILSNGGKLKRTLDVDASVESEPLVTAEKTIIFGTEGGKLYAFNAQGKELWHFTAKGAIRAVPVMGRLTTENDLVVGDMNGILYCLNEKGQEEWRFTTKGAIYGRATLADLNKDNDLEVVFGSCDNTIYCLSNRGEKLWSYETDFWIVSPPLVMDIDGDGSLEVVAGSFDHNLYVLDGEGTYAMDYMPGLSGVAHQAGHYSTLLTQEPGEQVGKRLWQLKTQGMVVGCEILDAERIVVNVKSGFVDDIMHTE